MKTPLQEKWLLYKIVNKKDADAFGVLYNAYIERIYRFVYFKLASKEEAEDATNDIFLRTWRYLIDEGHKPISSFSGLLYRIARNVVIDIYREKAKKQVLRIDEEGVFELGEKNTMLETLALKQESQKVEQHLKRLKQEYQEVIILRYIEELSVREIASILGKTPVNVRVLLHRALKKLKTLMEQKS